MVDKARVLSKLDELDQSLKELSQIQPGNFHEFQKTEIKRSCERLLQLCVECTIAVCEMLVAGLRLGLPSEENDIFGKLERAGFITSGLAEIQA